MDGEPVSALWMLPPLRPKQSGTAGYPPRIPELPRLALGSRLAVGAHTPHRLVVLRDEPDYDMKRNRMALLLCLLFMLSSCTACAELAAEHYRWKIYTGQIDWYGHKICRKCSLLWAPDQECCKLRSKMAARVADG